MRLALPALASLALTLAACASAPTDAANTPAADRDCFNAENVNGFSYIDNEHIGVSIGANRKYILTTMFNARDLDWTHVIAIRSTTSWICTGNGLGVELIGGEPRRTYPITAIERAPDPAPNAEQGS
jgi:Family of unknown function (DUF6491)